MPSRRSSHPRNPQRDHTQRIGWSAARTQYPLWAGTPGKGPDLPAACRRIGYQRRNSLRGRQPQTWVHVS